MTGRRATDIDALLATIGTDDLGVDMTAVPDEGVTMGATVDPGPVGMRASATAPEASMPPPPPADVPLIELEGSPGTSDFEVRDAIGEGAMGRVHLAWHRSVGREVAVKIPLDGPRRGSRINAVVREARVTGRLEHPNIVPMHCLARTPDGATAMIMKRVEGTSWREIADDPARLPDRFRGADRLECHLRMLLEVCDAVHFAHSRGVLHRDLKLDNVLVGAYGEVYVVDWGIAVALREDGTGHLPLARDVCRPAGTPGYMAPEMAAGEGERLGPTSDVYCLGALLHRLLIGTTRHVGRTYGEVLGAAFVSTPFDYGPHPDVPRELGRICNRACHPDPDARFPDVAAFRGALVDFLQHRDSDRLVDEAAQAVDRMVEAEARGTGDAVDTHFGAARFALEHALRIWPENTDARQALDRLLLERAEKVFEGGQVTHASQLVSVLGGGSDGADDDVGRRIATLVARIEAARAEDARRARLARNADLSVFSRHRGAIAFGLGLLWTLNGFRRVATPPPTQQLIVDQVWMIAIIFGIIFALRRWLWSTVINRRVSLALMAIVTMDMAIRLAGWALGLPSNQVCALEMVVDAGGVLYLALLVDLRLLAAVVPMAVCAGLGLTHPDEAYRISAWNVFIALSIIGGIWMWRAPGQQRRGSAPDDAAEADDQNRYGAR